MLHCVATHSAFVCASQNQLFPAAVYSQLHTGLLTSLVCFPGFGLSADSCLTSPSACSLTVLLHTAELFAECVHPADAGYSPVFGFGVSRREPWTEPASQKALNPDIDSPSWFTCLLTLYLSKWCIKVHDKLSCQSSVLLLGSTLTSYNLSVSVCLVLQELAVSQASPHISEEVSLASSTHLYGQVSADVVSMSVNVGPRLH